MLHQKAVGLDHDDRITRLHRQYDVVEALIGCYAQELQGTFHHAGRIITVSIHDTVAERTMVGSNAQRRTVLRTDAQERQKALTHALQLGVVGGIIVFDNLELLFVDVVARIDAHLLNDAGSDLGSVWRIVNVGNQGSGIAT